MVYAGASDIANLINYFLCASSGKGDVFYVLSSYIYSSMEDQLHTKHLNLNVRGLAPSATLAINEKSNDLIKQGRTIYKLGLGQSPFPVPIPVRDALRNEAHQKDYLPVKGLYELRKAIADANNKWHGINSDADHVMIGPGSKELIFILQLVYYGDLIIPAPGWVSYSPQAHIIGRRVHLLSTRSKNKWQLTAEQLDLLCRTDPSRPRIVILNYPANPTGCSYAAQKLKEIAEVARKYKVILISDEIYGLLHHEGKHVSIARYYPEGTIISSGLSKWCGAGGWRLGTFSFPKNLEWLMDAMAIVASETFTSTSAPIQHAAVRAFQGGPEIDEYLEKSRKVLKVLGHYLVERLRAMKLKTLMPDGAFYLFPDFENYREKLNEKGIYTSVELCNRLLEETGVAMLPGHDFGRDPDELTVRLAYVDFDGQEALSHVNSIDPKNETEWIQKHAPRLVAAFDELQKWLALL